MKQLTEAEVKQFVTELKGLCKRYNMRDASFCATNEKKYAGIIGIDIDKLNGVFSTILNVGRLWHIGREKVKNLLDDFEK